MVMEENRLTAEDVSVEVAGGMACRGRNETPRSQICRSHGHTAIYCYCRYSEQPPQAHVAVNDEVSTAAEFRRMAPRHRCNYTYHA